jgi:hypothetical protein
MGLSDITAQSVRQAIAECDKLGREAFRLRYGFGAAREYELVYAGRRYDSKAIMGVAHLYAVGRLLSASEFSGGMSTVVRRLRQLGFTVERHPIDPAAARKPLVLIAPCYGNPASRSRFADTLAHEVAFNKPPLIEDLDAEDLELLLKLHPTGTARFWGALALHDKKLDRLAPGDPILFTGLKHVQALGRLGCRLRNRRLADALWKPDPKTGSWSNVYSVLAFQPVRDITYSDIQVLAGYRSNDVFQETRVPSPDKAAAIISGLGLDADEIASHEEEDREAGERLLDVLSSDSKIIDAEASDVETGEYERTARTVLFRRAEARLVALYRKTLPEGQDKRLQLDSDFSDLYHVDDGDLIEAKRSSAHRYVRDALGQLLDYAARARHPINRLTALFPEAPARRDIELLNVYGIDCVYLAVDQEFCRLEAPVEARERLRPAWSSLVNR